MSLWKYTSVTLTSLRTVDNSHWPYHQKALLFVQGNSSLACHALYCSQMTGLLDQVSTGESHSGVPICRCQNLNSILNGNINQTYTQPWLLVFWGYRIKPFSMAQWEERPSKVLEGPAGLWHVTLLICPTLDTWPHPAGRVVLTLASLCSGSAILQKTLREESDRKVIKI